MSQRRRRSSSQRANEAKCRRCGTCCRDKYLVEDRIFLAAEGACEHLDPKTKLCTIYERRHDINPQCLSVAQGIELEVFPADCPYVRDLPNYRPPVDRPIDRATLRLIEEGQLTTRKDLERHLNALAEREEADARKKGRAGRSKGK